MAWKIKGNYYGPYSCKVRCPCALGETEADQGWCSGAMVFDIKSGNSDGVNLSGSKVAWVGDFPGGFLLGKGTARLYFDPSVSAAKRKALEGIMSGKKGGVFAAFAGLITKVLPTKTAAIKLNVGTNQTKISVGSFGKLVIKPLKGATGKLTRLLHAAAGFRDDIVLAKGIGSSWNDPQMRKWQSGGHAEQADFDWKA